MLKRSLALRGFYFALAIAALLALVSLSFSESTSASATLKTVIVQLKSDPVIVAKYRAEQEGKTFDVEHYRRQVIAEQESFLRHATAAGISYTIAGVSAPNNDVTANVKFRFNYVYNGIGLEVPSTSVAALKNLPEVSDVQDTPPMYAHLDRAIDYTRASSLYGNPPKLTRFDEADTGGLHGEGMIVAVIDTGVDWTHPIFGGDPTPPQFGFSPAVDAGGPNKKVIYYMNLTAGVAGDDFGHGTHVAGDIAGYTTIAPGDDKVPGTADDIKIHGVAPKARLMAYKTLSAAGTGSPLSSIMALEDAVQPMTISGFPKPVPHVINLSLGSADGGNPNSAASIACDNATLAGITVVASAGNNGLGTAAQQAAQDGAVGSPGAGRRVLTVGANNDPGKLPKDLATDLLFDTGAPLDLSDVLDPASLSRAQTGIADGTGKPVATGQRTNINLKMAGGSPAIGNPIAQYYVWAGTITTVADVPDEVAGRIVIARGSGAFATVVNSLAAKGAAAALIIRPDLAGITTVNSLIPVWGIQEQDAAYLLDLLSSTDNDAGDPAKGALSEYPVRIRLGSYTPAMAAFSSRGPIIGYGQVKPDVTAPGVQVLSSTVRAGGIGVGVSVPPGVSYMIDPTGYKSANGTSFSSPITAGIVALIKQKHPTWTPSMIRAALVNTATNLRQSNGTPLADGQNTILEQGGGLVDALEAAHVKALLGTGAPGPATDTITGRTFGVLVSAGPGNPDFSASYSFGAIPVSGVIGSSTHSQSVNIHDISGGEGAGTYRLNASNVRFVDGTSLQVNFTDESGNHVSEVTVPEGGSASFTVNLVVNGETITSPTQAQWYVTASRTDGKQNLRMPFYFRAIAPTINTPAPNLNGTGGHELGGNPPIDINGAYQLQYAKPATGTQPTQYRVQESADNGATWTTLADVPASQTTFDISERVNGSYSYRVIGLVPVQHGLYLTAPSTTRNVLVDRRLESDVTALIKGAMVSNSMSFAGSVMQFDWTLKNKSGDTTIYPPLQFSITSIQSRSGTVRVANAENSGDGVATPATFDYTSAAGADLAPGEVSGAKTLKFNNPDSEMFDFTVVVRGHLRDASGGVQAGGAGSSPSGGESGSGQGSAGQGTNVAGQNLPLTAPQSVLKFSVNPLTRSVKLVQ
jgi:subtilisin family serine protease